MDGSQFKKELSKLARLGAVKNSLPPTLRVAPVAAIAVGAVISKAMGAGEGSNFVESAVIGKDEDVTLLGPPPPTHTQADSKKEGPVEEDQRAKGDDDAVPRR